MAEAICTGILKTALEFFKNSTRFPKDSDRIMVVDGDALTLFLL